MNQIYKEFLALDVDQGELLDAYAYGDKNSLDAFRANGIEVIEHIQYEDYAKARKNSDYDAVEVDLIVMYKDELFRSGRTDVETSYSYEYEDDTSYSYGSETRWERWEHIKLATKEVFEYVKVTD